MITNPINDSPVPVLLVFDVQLQLQLQQNPQQNLPSEQTAIDAPLVPAPLLVDAPGRSP
jgi:hypothetical protein